MGRVVAVCRVCGSHDVVVTFTEGEIAKAGRAISTPLIEEGTPSAEHRFTLRTELPPTSWGRLFEQGVEVRAKRLRDKRKAWREQKRRQRWRKGHGRRKRKA